MEAHSTSATFSRHRHQLRGRRPHSASAPLLPSGRERRQASKERDEDKWTSSEDSDVAAAKESGWKNWDLQKAPGDDVEALQAARLKGKLRARELAELRRLVQHDERFSQVLNRHCHAIHELVASGNPSPVLALLAGLVWSSLCIAWEVENASGSMPKARVRAKLVQAEEELAKVKDSLHKSRCYYLKELTALRDQVRRLNFAAETEVSKLVHEEEPVMFYEPLNYLSDDVRAHVVEIVEEKMKLAVQRLQLSGDTSFITEAAPEVRTHKDKDAEKEKEREEREKAEREEAKIKAEERSQVLRKEQADMEVARRRKERAAQAEAALKAQMQALETSARDAEGELLRRCDESEAKAEQLQMVVTQLKAQQQTSQAELSTIVRAAKSEWEELSTLSSTAGQKPVFEPQGPEGTGTYVGKLLKLENEARKSLQQDLQRAKAAAKEAAEKAEKAEKRSQAAASAPAPKPKPPPPPEKPPEAVVEAAVEKARQEVKMAVKEAEDAKAEAHRQRLLAEEALGKQQAAEALSSKTTEAAASAQPAAKPAAASSQPAAKSQEEQLAPAQAAKSLAPKPAEAKPAEAEKSVLLGAENQRLRLEVEHLQQALVELQDYLSSARDETTARPQVGVSGLPRWTTSRSKVHERLFADSVDRKERKKALAESVQQAREVKALEIFQASQLGLHTFWGSELGAEGVPSSPDEESRSSKARQIFLTQEDIDAGFIGLAGGRGRSGSLRRQTPSPTAGRRRSPSPMRSPSSVPMADMDMVPLLIATAVPGREQEQSSAISDYFRRQFSASQSQIAVQVDDDSNVSVISASTSAALAIADKPGPANLPTWFAQPPPRLRAARPSSAKSARSATTASAVSSVGLSAASSGPQAGTSGPVGRMRRSSRSRPSSAVGSNPLDTQLLREGYRLLASQPGEPTSAISLLPRSASAPGLPSRRPPSAPSLRVPR